jgi:hypothetical protein
MLINCPRTNNGQHEQRQSWRRPLFKTRWLRILPYTRSIRVSIPLWERRLARMTKEPWYFEWQRQLPNSTFQNGPRPLVFWHTNDIDSLSVTPASSGCDRHGVGRPLSLSIIISRSWVDFFWHPFIRRLNGYLRAEYFFPFRCSHVAVWLSH